MIIWSGNFMTVKPFQQFDTWADFIFNVIDNPENQIGGRMGPGDAIGAGDWFLTKMTKNYYLSYVRTDGHTIDIFKIPIGEWIQDSPYGIPSGLPGDTGIGGKSNLWAGEKDGWGPGVKVHYKVNISSLMNFDFINWNSNPFEVKQ